MILIIIIIIIIIILIIIIIIIVQRKIYTSATDNICECYRQRNNPTFYERQDTDMTNTLQNRVTDYTKRMFDKGLIDKKNRQNPKAGRFYILCKIHKANNPGRPIVSSNSHVTELISQFVDFHLKPLVCTLPSYIKDTTDFVNKLASLKRLPNNVLPFSLDVTSLYI